MYIATAITLNVGKCALIGTLDTMKYFRQVYNIKIHLSLYFGSDNDTAKCTWAFEKEHDFNFLSR